MKRILITGGPTNEFIDEVMKITNMSTGSSAVELARLFAAHPDYQVVLVGNTIIPRSAVYAAAALADKPNFRFVPVETTQDMYDALEAESARAYDLVLHPAAVGDYKPEFTFTMADMARELAQVITACANPENLEELILQTLTNPSCKVDSSSKISSYEPHLTVKLTLTTKLIGNMRRWFPGAKLIGFKLLENVTKEHILQVATALCQKNDMDYIVANDLAVMRTGDHVQYITGREGYTGVELHDTAGLYEFANQLL